MNICVFDTETTSLGKPFCYNIGFIIYNTETEETLYSADFVVEQIWHNLPLFESAYYAEKRPLYIKRMKGKTCQMEKFGYITQKMCRLFKEYEVKTAFAYNSSFDEKVFNFNCDWFKVKNPFDNIPIFDIRGYVHKFVAFTPYFQEWCEKEKAFTEEGNYSTTAETLYRFLSGDNEFNEEHTALADSEIELQILWYCLSMPGADITEDYKAYRSIPRKVKKVLHLIHNDKDFCFDYEKITINKDKTRIVLK